MRKRRLILPVRDVSGATLTALGAFSRATPCLFDFERRDHRVIPIEEQVELASLVGNLVEKDGEHGLHCHVIVAHRDGRTIGGHLLEARVHPTLEAVVIDAPAHLRRATDPATGLPLLVP